MKISVIVPFYNLQEYVQKNLARARAECYSERSAGIRIFIISALLRTNCPRLSPRLSVIVKMGSADFNATQDRCVV